CASTGNLANSVAAHAARLGLDCCVFIPDNLEKGKILGSAIYKPTILAIGGNYDDVNRLCTQVADRYGWGFVNINLRSYYAEGAKTFGFEIVEQLGWRYQRQVVWPVAGGVAGTDAAIIEAIQRLAETERIFTEPAGGTTLAATIDLVRRGVIRPDESVVVCITGNGYKTTEVLADKVVEPVRLTRAFKDFE